MGNLNAMLCISIPSITICNEVVRIRTVQACTQRRLPKELHQLLIISSFSGGGFDEAGEV